MNDSLSIAEILCQLHECFEKWRGTCEVDATIKWDWDRCEPYWEHELSCGHTVTMMEPEPPNYCPECGRKVAK